MKSLIPVEDVAQSTSNRPLVAQMLWRNEGIMALASSKAIELDTGRKIPAPRSEGWSWDEVTDSC